MNPVTLWWWSCRAYQKRVPVLPRLLKTLNFICFKAILPFQADFQRDIQLEHYGLGIVIHPNVTIGRGVKIYHHVTLAAETWVGSEHRIIVGDNVLIGAGAMVIGRENRTLRIGDGAKIGAGAVVTGDVAPGQTMIGSPARPLAPKA